MEKKQRKAQQQHQPQQAVVGSNKRPREEAAATGGGGIKRPRTEMGKPAASSNAPQQGERRSLGLVARAKAARGLKGKEEMRAKKVKKAVERPKDPYLLAEEEELKYLERKLGLTGEKGGGMLVCWFACFRCFGRDGGGDHLFQRECYERGWIHDMDACPCLLIIHAWSQTNESCNVSHSHAHAHAHAHTGKDKAKKEAKLFRDLMKYEGFDDSICDLIKATDRIAEMVQQPRSKGSSMEDGTGKGKGKTLPSFSSSSSSSLKQQQQGEGEAADDEEAFDSEEEEEEELDGLFGYGRDEGGVPDFLESDEEEGEE
jgi:hypothetical protein